VWLDEALLDEVLAKSPLESDGDRGQFEKSAVSIWLPLPDGTNVEFAVVESPIMEEDLAAQYPEIRTYAGRSLDGSGRFVRFDHTPQGFHAFVLGGRQIYIDPHGKEGVYVSYFADEHPADAQEFYCLSGDSGEPDYGKGGGLLLHGDTLRTYRLAVPCTGEYANFHGAISTETKNLAVAAITTTVNRVNGIYESELAIRLVLVGTNDQIVYLDPATDPFTSNTDESIIVGQSQATINSVIGAANYDIGHTFAQGALGGVADLGSVCTDNRKASGVTGRPSPVGDPFSVDYVAHEIGHQFGADHTFNSKRGACKGTRVASSAYERGSGTTIMSYAGICSGDNIEPHTDPYFHSESLRQIQSFINESSCQTNSATNNAGPLIDAGADYTIPRETPFTLTGSGDDGEADLITYSWEERDLGPVLQVTAADNGKSPLFRTYAPSGSNARTFPVLPQILAGVAVGDFHELLPSKSRTMTFWLIGRDSHGGFGHDEAKITVNAGSGPFKVTYPNTQVVIPGGKRKKVKWDVAKTNLAPVSAQNVKISLSIDGGQTFPTVLEASTPNDGEQKVKFPKTATLHARVKIEGTNNIFFDISDKDFAIDGGFSFVGFWHMRSEFNGQIGQVLPITLRDDGTSRLCSDTAQTFCSEGTWNYEEETNNAGFVVLFDSHDYYYEIVDSNTVNLYTTNGGSLERVMRRQTS